MNNPETRGKLGTRHITKTNKAKNITQKTAKYQQYKPHQLVDWSFFFGNLFIFPRTDLYIHDAIYTMFQYAKVTMQKQKLAFITYCFVITFEIQKLAF
jgi:hypothetical protein